MNLKKSKSGKKNSKVESNLKKIQDDIFEYVGQHHFHNIITEAMYKAYSQKSADPLKFMAEYLLEKRGIKLEDQLNGEIPLDSNEKDKTIKKLYSKVAELENIVEEQKTIIANLTIANYSSNSVNSGQNAYLPSDISLANTVSDISPRNSLLLQDIQYPSTSNACSQNQEKANKPNETDKHIQKKVSEKSDVTDAESISDCSDFLTTVGDFRTPERKEGSNDQYIKEEDERLQLNNPEISIENNFDQSGFLTIVESSESLCDLKAGDETEKNELEELETVNSNKIPSVSTENDIITHFDDFEPDYEPDDE